ncbi:MAG: ribonuclease HII [Candidatus Goldiibacteriota bacterium]
MKNLLLEFDGGYAGPVIGVDEAGRGPWAGPVVAAAVILDIRKTGELSEINDSKKIPEKKRELLYEKIIDLCSVYAVSEASAEVIDRDNVLAATLFCMKNCIEKLVRSGSGAQTVLVDGISRPAAEGIKIETIKDGDAKSLSIAAASIIAKVHRDRIMRRYDRMFPQYGFSKHKGYGTRQHILALEKYGLCEIHRKTYKPVAAVMLNEKK